MRYLSREKIKYSVKCLGGQDFCSRVRRHLYIAVHRKIFCFKSFFENDENVVTDQIVGARICVVLPESCDKYPQDTR